MKGIDAGIYELPLMGFDLEALNAKAARYVLGEDAEPSEVVVASSDYLASIQPTRTPCRICLHPILNVEWLPVQVLWNVLVHEYIHCRVPPQEEEPGVMLFHPPEFWEVEQSLLPETRLSWTWLRYEFPRLIWKDEEKQGMHVHCRWRRELAERRKALEDMYRKRGTWPAPEQHLTWKEVVVGVKEGRLGARFETRGKKLVGRA